MGRLGAVAIVLLGSMWSLSASAATCNFKKGELDLQFHELRQKVSYNHSKSGAEISAFSRKHNSVRRELKGHKVRGFTYYRLRSAIELSFAGKKYKDKTHCLYVKDAKFRVGFKKMEVYIDRKYSKGSCAYKAILEHENTHVNISNEMLTKFAPEIQKAFEKAVRKMPIRKTYKSKQMTVKMRDELLATMNAVVDDMSKALKKEQAKIDTPTSYRNVHQKCKNW